MAFVKSLLSQKDPIDMLMKNLKNERNRNLKKTYIQIKQEIKENPPQTVATAKQISFEVDRNFHRKLCDREVHKRYS